MKNRKHILLISQYYYPEQFRINDLSIEWVKKGYEVTVVTGIPNYPKGKFFNGYGLFKKRKEKYNGVSIIRLPIIPRGNSSFMLILNYVSFVVSGFFWKIFTSIKADYVFIFEVSPMTQALPGVWYSKRRHIPCYLYVQDLWPENIEIVAGVKNKTILKIIGKMVDYIYSRCDIIFASSESFCRNISNRGVSDKKVKYLPQYAEELYKPSESKSALIPQDSKLNITFTGNIGTAQGLEVLVDTAVLLKQEKLLVRFNIIGDGRNKDNLLKSISDKSVDEYFNIISWQPAEDIPSILSSSDAAFLSFSDNQLFAMTIPAKLQSYMACGVPIIGPVIGESKKIIEEAKCGMVCDLGSANSLKDVIKEFLNTTVEQRKNMSSNAIDYVDKYFNRTTLLDILDEYFNVI